MAQSILDILVKPNPDLDSSFVTRGPNTFNADWIKVNSWRPWRAFTYKSLLSIYSNALLATWRSPPLINPGSAYDYEIRYEHSLDLFLAIFMLPVVNGALERATKVLKMDEVFYLGPGCWVGDPDWALVSHHRIENGRYWNLLPGDTKLSAKWQPRMEQSQDDRTRHQWTLPVSQDSSYAAQSDCRYGFIITDLHLVVLRLSKESVGQGSALTRPLRVTSQISHQRIASGSTDISSALDAMSLDSFGSQSYVENNPHNMEYLPPEYATVPWTARGKGRLTVRMSLFCLCLMAISGYADVHDDYPPLDSWQREGPRLFRHNTSGFTATRLPKGASVVAPRAAASPDKDQSQVDNLDEYVEEGQDAEEGNEEEDYETGEPVKDGDEEEEMAGEKQGYQTQAGPSIGGSSGSKGKRTLHRVQLKGKNGQYHFRDLDNERRWTKKRDWTRSDVGGWEYRGKKHVYFVEHLPRDMED
ncbi:Uncharacterized protein TCAP_02092 [Tolypocladium capitatum]|uniref:Uncharacterized protein n=1 Tax=Tolypocladium capitatum TaxID=45235 RepID=A0A2K3QKB2_9HYPO|nr:Uncharacterized protein TCAP_02092 [Tolypocladium capitatum]